MIIPHTGKIVIVDDNLEQGLPLFRAFCRANIPSCYFTGKPEELPINPFDDVRMLFLDLDLHSSVTHRNVESTLIAVIKRILKKKTPYLLVFWSVRENDLGDDVRLLFQNQLKEYNPIKIISFNKSSLFKTGNDGNLVPVNNFVQRLENKISTAIIDVDFIGALIEWENIILKASGDIIKEYSSIVENDTSWNENLKYLFYKLAVAQIGEQIKSIKEKEISKYSLSTVNNSLLEQIQTQTNKIKLNYTINFSDSKKVFSKTINGNLYSIKKSENEKYILYVNNIRKGDERAQLSGLISLASPAEKSELSIVIEEYVNISPKINKQLLISKEKDKTAKPGNVYQVQVAGSRKRKLLDNYFNIAFLKRKDDLRYKYEISRIRFIELEVSPICDYSQNKWKKLRMLPGIILPSKYCEEKEALKNGDFFYKTSPSIYYNNESCKMIFDLRFLKSVYPNEFNTDNKRKLIFRFKNEPMIDILAKLSSNLSRPGITFVD